MKNKSKLCVRILYKGLQVPSKNLMEVLSVALAKMSFTKRIEVLILFWIPKI